MEPYLEIKWMGRSGQGLVTAATVLAEVLAMCGKYVQAFPAYDVEIQPPCLYAYNRLSQKPIKTHAAIQKADIVAIMDPTLILWADIGKYAKKEAIYIINTPYTPQYVKERISFSTGLIYTIDADLIAMEEIGETIPNIPMMTIMIQCIEWIPFDHFKEKLAQSLATQWPNYPDRVQANLNTLQRALNEVKELKTDG